ncbi:MAG: hypothetical protein E7509_05575 [Ruminococcus sp.]|nr:hypothetical protein [Ruminococcus sp.]
MKRENISEIIDNISSEYIDEAAEYINNKKTTTKKIWYKRLIPMVACLCLVIGGVFVVNSLRNSLSKPNDIPKSSDTDYDDILQSGDIVVNKHKHDVFGIMDMDVGFTSYEFISETEKKEMLDYFESIIGFRYEDFIEKIPDNFIIRSFYSVDTPADIEHKIYLPHDYVIVFETENGGEIKLSFSPYSKPLKDVVVNMCENPKASVINGKNVYICGLNKGDYNAQFLCKKINYDVEATAIKLDELVSLIDSITK